MNRRPVAIVVGAVLVMTCLLIAAPGSFTFEAVAENGTLTPQAYLPYITKQEPPKPYNLRAQNMVLQLADMPSGYTLDEDESGPVEFSDEIVQMGVVDGYEVWYENPGLLFTGTPIVYNLAAVFRTPQGAQSYIQRVKRNPDADPEASAISSPRLGDETVAYQAVAQDNPFVAYFMVFRKGNLVAGITTGGVLGIAQFDVALSFAELVLAKIHNQIAVDVQTIGGGSKRLWGVVEAVPSWMSDS